MPQAVALWTELRLPRRRPRAAVFPAALGGGKGLLEAIVLQSKGTTQSCFVCSGLMWQTASAGQMARGHLVWSFFISSLGEAKLCTHVGFSLGKRSLYMHTADTFFRGRYVCNLLKYTCNI